MAISGRQRNTNVDVIWVTSLEPCYCSELHSQVIILMEWEWKNWVSYWNPQSFNSTKRRVRSPPFGTGWYFARDWILHPSTTNIMRSRSIDAVVRHYPLRWTSNWYPSRIRLDACLSFLSGRLAWSSASVQLKTPLQKMKGPHPNRYFLIRRRYVNLNARSISTRYDEQYYENLLRSQGQSAPSDAAS